MHIRLTLFLLLFLPLSLWAQEVSYLIKPVNHFTGISNFSEGLAEVEIPHDSAMADDDSVWTTIGYIDTTGKIVFEKLFDEAGSFHCGLAYVSKKINDSTKYGFIDKNGKLVIPCLYDEVEDFSCDRVAVNRGGVWQIIDKSGKVIMNDSLLITEQEVEDVYAQTSREEDIEPPAFHNGLIRLSNDGKYGYADTSGKIVIPFKCYDAFDFKDGVAVVAVDTVDENRYDMGTVLDSLYNSLPSGPAQYKWTVIDTTGRVLYHFKEEETPDLNQYFSEGYISFSVDDYKNGVMNKYGKTIIPPQYANEPFPFSDGVTIVQVDDHKDDGNKLGYLLVIDTLGNTVSKIPLSNRYGLMYDSKQHFREGLMAVKINDKWGYIDKKGNYVVPPQFDEAPDFHNGCAVVKTDKGKLAVIENPLYH